MHSVELDWELRRRPNSYWRSNRERKINKSRTGWISRRTVDSSKHLTISNLPSTKVLCCCGKGLWQPPKTLKNEKQWEEKEAWNFDPMHGRWHTGVEDCSIRNNNRYRLITRIFKYSTVSIIVSILPVKKRKTYPVSTPKESSRRHSFN